MMEKCMTVLRRLVWLAVLVFGLFWVLASGLVLKSIADRGGLVNAQEVRWWCICFLVSLTAGVVGLLLGFSSLLHGAREEGEGPGAEGDEGLQLESLEESEEESEEEGGAMEVEAEIHAVLEQRAQEHLMVDADGSQKI